MNHTSSSVVSCRSIPLTGFFLLLLLLLIPEVDVKGDIVTTGTIRRYWSDLPDTGYAITDLTGSPDYPSRPTRTGLYYDMQYPQVGDTPASTGTNDGQTFTGWLIPSQTGTYTFWIGGVDRAELWLSTDRTSANATRIAYLASATPVITTTTTYDNVTTTSTLPDWTQVGTQGVSGAISLKANTPYYFQVLNTFAGSHKGVVAVGWTQPNDAPSTDGPAHVLTQYNLCPHSTYTLTPSGSGWTTAACVASRFLAQATFGGTQGTGDPSSILDMADLITTSTGTNTLATGTQIAINSWLDYQFSLPFAQATDSDADSDLSLKQFRYYVQKLGGGGLVKSVIDPQTGVSVEHVFPNYPNESYRQHTFDAGEIRAGLMLNGRHDLRRKVAWALSQIFVVGDTGTALYGAPEGECDYYDMLAKDAFTDFKTILHDVTYHPLMGEFLSSAGNAKAGYYSTTSHPDENYAREIMQLFSIGLYKLDHYGTIQVDANNVPIPTYDIDDVTEMAKVFTGLTYPDNWIEHAASTSNPLVNDLLFGSMTSGHYAAVGNARYGVMTEVDALHDTGVKHVLGHTIPEDGTTHSDIDAALNILVNHPSAGPFFCKQLIQHLVTSNPSPFYIHRVFLAFITEVPNATGGGTHIGDMPTIITAILTDSEARAYDNPTSSMSTTFGKYQEPWIRLMEVARAFQAPPKTSDGVHYPLYEKYIFPVFGEYPLGSPSVFNFYLPTYQPPPNGSVNFAASGLVGPEFQLLNANTGVAVPNYFMKQVNAPSSGNNYGSLNLVATNQNVPVTLDFNNQMALAGNAATLLDNLDMLLTHGRLKGSGAPASAAYTSILGVLNALPGSTNADKLKRVQTAVYLISISPTFAVQK